MMDVNIELKTIPIKRTILMLKTGEIHADLSRARSFEKHLPSAVRVEEPLVSYPLWVFSIHPGHQGIRLEKSGEIQIGNSNRLALHQ